jgi:acetyltransferase-like isoleucine patch superfamily enzyme
VSAVKKTVSGWQRWKRFLLGIVDPRAWAHGLKLVSFFNHAHVVPLRRLKRGTGCMISPTATFTYSERIEFGNNVLIGEDCRLWAGPSVGRIDIGDDVMLGPGVLITAAGYRHGDGAPIRSQAMDEADVRISADVWIGAGVIVLPGTTIGAGAVIGAGSVVRGAIPSMAVAAGVPARVVGHRGREFDQSPSP